MTLFELLAFISWVGCGVAAAMFGHHLFGWAGAIGGFVLGAAGALFALLWIFKAGSYLEDMLYRGRPRRPICKNGICQFGDYKGTWDHAAPNRRHRFQFRCQCGIRYEHMGRRFMEVLPDESLKPYMVWKPFCGWFPDDEEGQKLAKISDLNRS
jgi:hypothetical protein